MLPYLVSFVMRWLIFMVFFHPANGLLAQIPLAGFGRVENLHIGLTYPIFKSSQGESSFGAGLPVHNTTFSLTQKFGVPLFESAWSKDRYSCFLFLNTTCWSFNNSWNYFLNVSYGPELQLRRRFGRTAELCFYTGILRNNVLVYERKTNEAVGWPRNWQPSFGIQWRFISNK